MGQKIPEKSRVRRSKEEVRRTEEEESDIEEVGEERLRVETAVTEEEAAENLQMVMEMKIEEEGVNFVEG